MIGQTDLSVFVCVFVCQYVCVFICVYMSVCMCLSQQLLIAIIDHMADFNVSVRQFETIKQEWLQNYDNQTLKPEKFNKLVACFHVASF